MFVLSAPPAVAAEKARPYQFGVHPYLVPRIMAAAYGPAARDLSSKLDHPVRLLTTTNFTKFVDKLRRQEYDIAIVQPQDFPRVVKEFGYVPVARVNEELRAIFVIRTNSDANTLADLSGRRVAMPPRDAATSRTALRAMETAGLNPASNVTVSFLNTHDACLQEVLRGAAAACVTWPPPLEEFVHRTGAKLRVLATTEPVPHLATVVHSRVPMEQREAVRNIMLTWDDTSDGKIVLAAMRFPGWTEIGEREHAEIEGYSELDRAQAVPADKPGLLFGAFPYLSPRLLAAHLAPLAEALATQVSVPVHLRTASNHEQFELNLRERKYDIALISPFQFRLAMESDYEPVARFSDDLQGVFYVPMDSPVRDLQGLRGATIAMPPPAGATTILGMAHLRGQGIEPGRDVQIDHRASHDSCVERVLQGNAAACVTTSVIIGQLPASQRAKLRAVDKTASIPSLVLVVQRRHNVASGAKLREEVLSWPSRPEQSAALERLGLGDFVAVHVRMYLALPFQR